MMSTEKRIFSFLLAIICLVAATAQPPLVAYAKEGKEIVGYYKDGATEKKLAVEVDFSKSYFKEDASTLSKKMTGNIAKISMLAAGAAYHESNAKQLMKKCGFKGTAYKRNKVSEDDNDHVSYVVGYMPMDGDTLIAVWVKGTNKDYEWVSNFNLGKSGNHDGFYKAESELHSQVDDYIREKNITGNLRFWITGHSRGAAVANVYAKNLTDIYGRENVYGYTFATPRVSVHGKKVGYTNIINYLNPGDFVTEVAPLKWGFKRYGIDKTFSGSTKAKMTDLFESKTGVKYGGFGVEGKKSLVNAFVKYGGKNVEDYYSVRSGGKVAPVVFCQLGLAYILANEKSGFAYVAGIAATDSDARLVFEKMAIDGKLSNKFAHAHTQASYMCWLEAMYPYAEDTADDVGGGTSSSGNSIGKGTYKVTYKSGTGSCDLVAISKSSVSYKIENTRVYSKSFKKGEVIYSFYSSGSSIDFSFTVHSGSVEIRKSENSEGTLQTSVKKLATPLFYGKILKTGKTLTIANEKYDGDITSYQVRIYTERGNASGTVTLIDGWWHRYYPSMYKDVKESNYKQLDNGWRDLKSMNTIKYNVTSGAYKIFVDWEDKDKLSWQ